MSCCYKTIQDLKTKSWFAWENSKGILGFFLKNEENVLPVYHKASDLLLTTELMRSAWGWRMCCDFLTVSPLLRERTRRFAWRHTQIQNVNIFPPCIILLIALTVTWHIQYEHTVGREWNFKKHILWSKLARFKKAWHILRVLSCPCPLDFKLIF